MGCTVKWVQQETVEMPQLQSIDEVVEIREPLEEAVSIAVEALMKEVRWEMEKEQQMYVNIGLWIQSNWMEPDSTERHDDATNEANEE